MAAYLKSHPRARVEVRGYSSPEGPLATNIRIAKQRAEAVKNLLIAQYGILKIASMQMAAEWFISSGNPNGTVWQFAPSLKIRG